MRKTLLAGAALAVAGCAAQLPPMLEHPTLAYCEQVFPNGDTRKAAWNDECNRRVVHDSFDRAVARDQAQYPNGHPPPDEKSRTIDDSIAAVDRAWDNWEFWADLPLYRYGFRNQ